MSTDSAAQWGWKSVKLTATGDPETGSSARAEGTNPAAGVPGTFIGSDALFEGKLQIRGDFQINSEFRGAIVTDGKIVVGPSGSVVGDIRAREVEIFGAVVGDVSARRELTLHAGSRLHGGITTACLEIERHAFVSGTTSMTEPQTTFRRADATTPERASPLNAARPPSIA